jgi:nucleoid-associated protein YgaU
MSKPAGKDAYTAFYTMPIQERSAAEITQHIKASAALTGRANRRLANQLAANVMDNTPVKKSITPPANDSSFKISMVPHQHDIKIL